MSEQSNRFIGKRYGDRRGPLNEMLQLQRMLERANDLTWTIEPCVVVGYDFDNQTVDVRLKNHPDIKEPIRSVPIAQSGGDFRIYRSLKASSDPTKDDGDVGLLLFPRSDSRHAFHNKKLGSSFTNRLHTGLGPVFLPGPLTLDEPHPPGASAAATSTDLDNYGPKDTALIHKNSDGTYSSIYFKEDGEVVIKAKKVYIGTTSQLTSDMKEAARKGDAGDGTGGAIAGGSNNVFLG